MKVSKKATNNLTDIFKFQNKNRISNFGPLKLTSETCFFESFLNKNKCYYIEIPETI